MSYAASVKYSLNSALDPAIEIHGGVGALDHVAPGSVQTHWIGPALYGAFPDRSFALCYRLAAVSALTEASPNTALIGSVEHEFRWSAKSRQQRGMRG